MKNDQTNLYLFLYGMLIGSTLSALIGYKLFNSWQFAAALFMAGTLLSVPGYYRYWLLIKEN